MSRTLRRLAVVLLVGLTSLLGTTALASADPAPRQLTPTQQQALCIAKESVRLLAAIDKQTWKDKKAREAAVRTIPARAKAACPLGGAPQSGGHSVNEVAPTATRVVDLGGGRYRFEWDRSLPAGAKKGDVLFTFTEKCPNGATVETDGTQPANPINNPYDFADDGAQRSVLWYRSEPPQPPLGITYSLTCDDRTG